jgi:hypothetical protein
MSTLAGSNQDAPMAMLLIIFDRAHLLYPRLNFYRAFFLALARIPGFSWDFTVRAVLPVFTFLHLEASSNGIFSFLLFFLYFLNRSTIRSAMVEARSARINEGQSVFVHFRSCDCDCLDCHLGPRSKAVFVYVQAKLGAHSVLNATLNREDNTRPALVLPRTELLPATVASVRLYHARTHA